MVFLVLALYVQSYMGLVNAGICGVLGIGVKRGSAPSRWVLAVYAFLSPIVSTLATRSRSGELWPFLFFAVCRSILAHQKESQLGTVNGVGTACQGDVPKAASAIQSEKLLVPVTVPKEPCQHTSETLEDRLYEQIARELEANTVDKGLWTKVYAQAGGDDQQTRVLYIKARFARLLVKEDA